MIDAILFDKDGTLFDFQASWSAAMRQTVNELAVGHEEAAAEALGFDLIAGVFRDDSLVIAGTVTDIAGTLSRFSAASVPELAAAVDRIAAEASMAPVVGLEASLTELGRDRPLGVVTNDTEAPARAHLASAGIDGFFDFVAGFDSGYGQKPGPGPLLAFAEQVGHAPERVLMVGDSLTDLVAAKSAGMPSVAVLTGVAGVEELSPFADVVLPDITHIAGWITDTS